LLASLTRWDSEAALLAISVPPVLVGIGVAAHLHSAGVARSLGALAVTLTLAFGIRAALRSPGRTPVRSMVGPLPLPAAVWLALATVIGTWLSLSSRWWLLPAAAFASAALLAAARRPGPRWMRGLQEVAALVVAELLAGWGTVWVEVGCLPLLGGLAAILPAALAAGLLLLINLRDLPADLHAARVTAVVRLGTTQARRLFLGLLALALAVPLLITIPGLGGAECFLPWVAAPVAEGPIRNSAAAGSTATRRAVRQMELLLVASCVLLAIGIWAG
jgi:1,4-dihydroxy-2-naphthoate octaprenyltransferase